MSEAFPPAGLTPYVARHLALLADANQDAAEAAIALWPIDVRIELLRDGIISPPGYGGKNFSVIAGDWYAAAAKGDPVQFSLTGEGLRVIKKAAVWAAQSCVVKVEPFHRRLGYWLVGWRHYPPGTFWVSHIGEKLARGGYPR